MTLDLFVVSPKPEQTLPQRKHLHLKAISVDSSIIFANGPRLARVDASDAVLSGMLELEGSLNLLQNNNNNTPVSKQHHHIQHIKVEQYRLQLRQLIPVQQLL